MLQISKLFSSQLDHLSQHHPKNLMRWTMLVHRGCRKIKVRRQPTPAGQLTSIFQPSRPIPSLVSAPAEGRNSGGKEAPQLAAAPMKWVHPLDSSLSAHHRRTTALTSLIGACAPQIHQGCTTPTELKTSAERPAVWAWKPTQKQHAVCLGRAVASTSTRQQPQCALFWRRHDNPPTRLMHRPHLKRLPTGWKSSPLFIAHLGE
ncbi:hypothetical protein PGT21_033542 [Puccinia graminis f. sp. tritici]|uniref:Uncharacterized protein n=2 Tax=Puccinia graminis f. sp. tritici TaxID=56615 RepID=E3LBA4_PUCGT|nr:uncharacterized protein PGTG_19864 [Puccinia graminis f. sp. tritici CRL 75-36-700-3]EFP93829.2 hypothetical protein PGTG_19864 [Puccinia graminis f. sp. tritici CRL 75-36-700-3]KAA1075314.1 hypothetical protein PGT21_033542 [Puccinia graminis f. sp. tritici]